MPKANPGADPNDYPAIDATESARHEIPAELERKVGMYWPTLTEVRIEHKPAGESWRETKQRFKLGDPPPTVSAEDVCLRILDLALEHANKNDPSEKYRAKMLCKSGEGTKSGIVRRYAELAPMIDPDGAIMLTDQVVAGGPGGDVEDPLMARMDEMGALMIRSLAANVEASEAFAGTIKMANELLDTHIKSYKHIAEQGNADAEIQFRIAELDAQRDAYRYDYELRRNRQDHLGGFFTTLAGPIGEMLQDLGKELGFDFAAGAAGGKDEEAEAAKAGAPCELAGDLADFLERLEKDKRKYNKFQEIFTPEEWALLESGREAESNEIFGARFNKMASLIRGRGLSQQDFSKKLFSAIGMVHMGRLNRIWKKLAEMGL